MTIIIRADSGFSGAAFYKLTDEYNLKYAIGLATNERLKKKVKRANDALEFLYQKRGDKHQHFISFNHKPDSWHQEQQCYSKVESTGKSLVIRVKKSLT